MLPTCILQQNFCAFLPKSWVRFIGILVKSPPHNRFRLHGWDSLHKNRDKKLLDDRNKQEIGAYPCGSQALSKKANKRRINCVFIARLRPCPAYFVLRNYFLNCREVTWRSRHVKFILYHLQLQPIDSWMNLVNGLVILYLLERLIGAWGGRMIVLEFTVTIFFSWNKLYLLPTIWVLNHILFCFLKCGLSNILLFSILLRVPSIVFLYGKWYLLVQTWSFQV